MAQTRFVLYLGTKPRETKPIVTQKEKKQVESKPTVTPKEKDQVESKPEVIHKEKKQIEPKPTVTPKEKNQVESRPTVTRKAKRLSMNKPLPATSTIITRSKAKKLLTVTEEIQSDQAPDTSSSKKSTHKVKIVPIVKEIQAVQTTNGNDSVLSDEIVSPKPKKMRTSYALRSKTVKATGGLRVAKSMPRVIRKSFRFADTRNEGPLCLVKIVDFEADFPYALRKRTRRNSMFSNVL